MGMDIYGKAPSGKAGTYFRNNIWWWHPLADYILMVAPEETAACTGWHVNGGDGLDKAGALALADKLQAEIDSGRCARYALSRGTVGNDSTDDKQAIQMVEGIGELIKSFSSQDNITIEAETN